MLAFFLVLQAASAHGELNIPPPGAHSLPQMNCPAPGHVSTAVERVLAHWTDLTPATAEPIWVFPLLEAGVCSSSRGRCQVLGGGRKTCSHTLLFAEDQGGEFRVVGLDSWYSYSSRADALTAAMVTLHAIGIPPTEGEESTTDSALALAEAKETDLPFGYRYRWRAGDLLYLATVGLSPVDGQWDANVRLTSFPVPKDAREAVDEYLRRRRRRAPK